MKQRKQLRRRLRLKQEANPTNKTRTKNIFGKRYRVSPQPQKGKGKADN